MIKNQMWKKSFIRFKFVAEFSHQNLIKQIFLNKIIHLVGRNQCHLRVSDSVFFAVLRKRQERGRTLLQENMYRYLLRTLRIAKKYPLESSELLSKFDNGQVCR